MVDYQLSNLFPTVLLSTEIAQPQLNKELVKMALAWEKEDIKGAGEQTSRSNLGGWHSPTVFFTRNEPCVKKLQGYIVEAIKHYIERSATRPIEGALNIRLTGWVNINRRGDYNKPHNHGGCHFSGVYYPSVGKNDPLRSKAGFLEFADPRLAYGMTNSVLETALSVTFEPKDGALVLFPSWLLHWVHPYAGEGQRISISFNAIAGFAEGAQPQMAP